MSVGRRLFHDCTILALGGGVKKDTCTCNLPSRSRTCVSSIQSVNNETGVLCMERVPCINVNHLHYTS